MPSIVFVQADGSVRAVEAPVGITVMEVARQQGIAGIVAQCGGACACATCHVYVDPAWLGQLDAPEDMELGMLETAWQPRPNSRLSCQIPLTRALDGLKVAVPARQAGAGPDASLR
jgi:2Fe-2S ferredoxin